MNASTGDVRELRSLDDFRAVTAAGVGYLVVTDRSTPTRVHRARCTAVAERHFVTKVIENGGRRGRYHHALTLEAVRARFPAGRLCVVCRPE